MDSLIAAWKFGDEVEKLEAMKAVSDYRISLLLGKVVASFCNCFQAYGTHTPAGSSAQSCATKRRARAGHRA